jgi:hypothetical protein
VATADKADGPYQTASEFQPATNCAKRRPFMRIDNAALRRRIVMLVQEIAGDDD